MVKQLIYSKFQTRELVAAGEHKDYEYAIINLGSNPCCYVKLDSDHRYAGHNHNNIPIECHGGLSYSQGYLIQSSTRVDEDGWWIGWDYAHPGDYMPYLENHITADEMAKLKKWTTAELIEECKFVIEQLIHC